MRKLCLRNFRKMIKINSISDNDKSILDAARNTVNKEPTLDKPSRKWMKKVYFSEHSPIRKKIIDWTWKGIKYWVSVHLVRHKIGCDHFVSSQRTDRTGINRDSLVQSTPVNHNMVANAQSIINISRKRLCKQAHKETTKEWQNFLNILKDKEPELVSVCVPECVYRGGICPEFKSCGYNKTEDFRKCFEEYIKDFSEQYQKPY